MSGIADISREYSLVDKHETWTNAGPVLSHLPDTTIEALRERAVATAADPGALGLWGFATGTWMAATILGGFVSGNGVMVAPVLIFFAGIAQFIAGLYAYRRANVLNATAFTCFGAFNTAAGVMILLQLAGSAAPAGPFHTMLGFLLESFAFIALALAAGAAQRNVVLTGLLLFLCAGYCLTGIGQFVYSSGSPGIVGAVGGACLLVSAFLAYYLGAALVTNSACHRTVLPIMGEP